MRLYLDTAISSNWHYEKEAPDDLQPHLVRLSWMQERDGVIVRDASHLIRLPDGYVMPEKTQHAIGIYDWKLLSDGKSLEGVLTEFNDALGEVNTITAFAWQHHRKVLERSYRYLGWHVPTWPRAVCAMIKGTPVIQVPAMRPGGGWKWPSYGEAYEKITGQQYQPTNNPSADGLNRLYVVRILENMIDQLEDTKNPQQKQHANHRPHGDNP
jgi:DNA polymerase-3 subunit alpha